MSGAQPAIQWVQPKKKLPEGLGCATILVAVALTVLAGNAGSGEEPFTFGRSFWIAVLTNPLCWLFAAAIVWGFKVIDATQDTLRWKCPHCGGIFEPSDSLRKGALNTTWKCTGCNNDFCKATAP